MTSPPAAVAHLVTSDAIARGEPRVDIHPEGVALGEQAPVWTQRVPPAHQHDVDAYLRGLSALGWPPAEQLVEIERGYAAVPVVVPDDMAAAVQARAPIRPRPTELASTIADDLADELGTDPGDMRILLQHLDVEPGDQVDVAYAAALRDQVDHHGERSVPGVWWPGSDPDAGTGATMPFTSGPGRS